MRLNFIVTVLGTHKKLLGNFLLKFIYSEKATKILRNLPLTFDYSTYSQKLGEDYTANPFPVQITGISLCSNSTL